MYIYVLAVGGAGLSWHGAGVLGSGAHVLIGLLSQMLASQPVGVRAVVLGIFVIVLGWPAFLAVSIFKYISICVSYRHKCKHFLRVIWLCSRRSVMHKLMLLNSELLIAHLCVHCHTQHLHSPILHVWLFFGLILQILLITSGTNSEHWSYIISDCVFRSAWQTVFCKLVWLLLNILIGG